MQKLDSNQMHIWSQYICTSSEYFKNWSATIDYNLANANEHVPEDEGNNRTIKEPIHATLHSLPFQALPTTFIKHLATETADKLNFFPPVNGISAYYSPRGIMSRQQLDYFKHCSLSQFSYVQTRDDPELKNTQHARTNNCIYICKRQPTRLTQSF